MGDYKGLFYELPILRTYQGIDQLLSKDILFDKEAVEGSNNPIFESANRLFRLAGDEQEKIEEKYKIEITEAAQDMGGEDSFVFKIIQNLANSAIKDNTQELIGLNCKDDNKSEDSFTGDDCKILQAEQGFVNTYVEFMEFIGGILEGGEEVDEVRQRLLKIKQKNVDNVVLTDVFNKLYGDTKSDTNHVFVVYENGESKGLEDYEMSFPIPADLNHLKDNALQLAVTYAALNINTKLDDDIIKAIGGLTDARGVFPKLTDSKASYEYLEVSNSTNTEKTKQLADMDKIITKDYNSNIKNTMIKAMFDAAVKTALNAKAASTNPLLGLAANKAIEAVNHSDLRRVVGLPKDYQLTLLDNTGVIEIKDNKGKAIFEKISLDKSKNYLIYVKSPKVGTNYIKVIEGKSLHN